MIGAARAAASKSITSLSGDLSWIEADLPNLRAVRIVNPGLRMTVFYDKFRVSPALTPLLSEVEQIGVEMRPVMAPSAFSASTAAGYAGFLSTFITRGIALPDASVAWRRKRLAAEVSRLAVSRESIVWPVESIAL